MTKGYGAKHPRPLGIGPNNLVYLSRAMCSVSRTIREHVPALTGIELIAVRSLAV